MCASWQVMVFACVVAKSSAAVTCTAPQTLKTGVTCGDLTCSTSECCEGTTYTNASCAGQGIGSCSGSLENFSIGSSAVGTTQALCCLVPRALCSTATCPSGYKAKTGAGYCSGGTCSMSNIYGDTTTCCELDATKCSTFTCPSTKYVPAMSWGTAGTTEAECCVVKPACSAYDCTASLTTGVNGVLVTAAFYESDASKGTDTYEALAGKSDTPWTAQSSSSFHGTCCKVKTMYCGGTTANVTCGSGTTMSQAEVGSTVAACCKTRPTCANYVAAVAPPPGASASATHQETPHLLSLFFLALLVAQRG